MNCITKATAGTGLKPRLLAAASFLFGLLIVGCGGSTDGRVPLAGQVFLDGQPLDRGSIEFHPRTDSGTLTGGMIMGGRFEVPADQGAKPGTYQVRIFAAGDTVQVDPNEPPGPESAQPAAAERIPPRFNTNSELEVEVGTSGSKDLRFDVQST